MPAIVGFAVLSFVIGGAVCGGVCFWIGKSVGKEQEAKKWKKTDEWKREEVTHYE